MAVLALNEAAVWLGALDASGFTTDVSFGPLTVKMVDRTTFGTNGFKAQIPGIFSGDHKLTVTQDFAAAGFDVSNSFAQLGSQFPYSVAPIGPGASAGSLSDGDLVYLTRIRQAALNPLSSAKVGDGADATLDLVSDAPFVRGQVAAIAATRTTTASGTTLTLAGPTASQSVYAALHVFPGSSGGNLTVRVQSAAASNFVGPTTRGTFTVATGATSQWMQIGPGAVTDGFWRFDWTISAGTFVFAGAVGVL